MWQVTPAGDQALLVTVGRTIDPSLLGQVLALDKVLADRRPSGLISTVPVRRPFTALMLLPKVIIGVLLPAAVKTSELKSLPIPFVEKDCQALNAVPTGGFATSIPRKLKIY